MPKLNDMFPSKYLKAEDLRGKDGRGWREFTLKINSVDLEDMGGENGDQKWVLHFEGAQKGLVLNRTNAQTLSDAYGPDSDYWIGEKVVLFVMTVGTPQGPKPGIRTRVPAADATTSEPMVAAAEATFDPDKFAASEAKKSEVPF